MSGTATVDQNGVVTVSDEDGTPRYMTSRDAYERIISDAYNHGQALERLRALHARLAAPMSHLAKAANRVEFTLFRRIDTRWMAAVMEHA